MKTVNQKWTCLLLIYILSCFVPHLITGEIMDEQPIILIPPKGWKDGGENNSRVMIHSVSASIDGSLLHIQCTSPTVDITVCIIQNGMIVHQETIPATDTNHILVDLTNYVEGVYTLDLTNSAGGHVWGEFSLL